MCHANTQPESIPYHHAYKNKFDPQKLKKAILMVRVYKKGDQIMYPFQKGVRFQKSDTLLKKVHQGGQHCMIAPVLMQQC